MHLREVDEPLSHQEGWPTWIPTQHDRLWGKRVVLLLTLDQIQRGEALPEGMRIVHHLALDERRLWPDRTIPFVVEGEGLPITTPGRLLPVARLIDGEIVC
jgi:hypothetical protein